jgi:hypothetical protein
VKVQLCRVVRHQALQYLLLYLRVFALRLALKLHIRVRGLLQKIRVCLLNCVHVLFLLNIGCLNSCVLVLLFGDIFAFLLLALVFLSHVLETGDFEGEFEGRFFVFGFAE